MKRILMILLLVVTMSTRFDVFGRDYNVTFDKATPEAVINLLKAETGMTFVYQKDVLNRSAKTITGDYTGLSLDQLLHRIINLKMHLSYEIVDKTIIISLPDASTDLVKGTISGIVYDSEENVPLIGVNVFIDGTSKATVTDMNGKFTFTNVNAINPVVTATFVGMKPVSKKITAKNQSKLRFDLEPQATLMNEVVITGYQEVKKEKMTGAVTTISAEKLEERYTPNLLDNLEGKVAGLSTYGGRPVIRGLGTLRGSSTPLLVVDGLPIQGDISDLNPYDIASVNVLKDAAASAIYGARAANGIIVVTTKNARKKGKIDIDFSTNITWYENKNMDYHDNFYMTPEEHINAERDYYEYFYFEQDGTKNNPMQNIAMLDMYMNFGYLNPSPVMKLYHKLAKGEITRDELNAEIAPLYNNNYAQDYADAIYRRQVIQQYNFALRSSSDKARNNIVVDYKHNNMGIVNHKNEWLNVSYKGNFDIAKWLTATASINSIIENRRQAGYDNSSMATNPFAYAPYTPFYNEDGTVRRNYYVQIQGNDIWEHDPVFKDLDVNPLEEMYANTITRRRQNLRFHGDLLFKILPGLTLNTQFIYENEMINDQQHATAESHAVRTIRNAYTISDGRGGWKYLACENGGFLQKTSTAMNSWTARAQINYNRRFFEKHDITVIAGLEFRENKYNGTRSLALGYDEQLQTSNSQTVDFATLASMRNNPYYMSAAGGFPSLSNAYYPYIMNATGIVREEFHRYGSGYFNATYTFDERYNVFGSFRKDYADVFGLNSKFRGKPLWSVGAGWNIHKEAFMRDFTNIISFLKLRFSYGVTGNIYQGATSVMTASSGTTNKFTNQPNGSVTSPANPDLRWEQSRTTNVGLDFSLLNYRLRGSFDYYNKDGKDIFNNMNLDPTVGFTSMVANAACVLNRGVEFQVSYDWFRPAKRRSFSWTTGMTFTYNKNEVTKVENDATMAYQLMSNPYRVGYPVRAMWSYRYAEISNQPGMEGKVLYYGDNDTKTTNPMSASVDALTFSGQSDPKYIVGLDNQWTWNGLSLSVMAAYYGGHKMRAIAYNDATGFIGFAIPMASYFNNAWTPENPTDMPGMGKYAGESSSSMARYADRSVRDASFIKIRNITLGYTIPENWSRRYGINQLTLRFQINNPKALWQANKVGVDPETGGIRMQSSYMVGLNINL